MTDAPYRRRPAKASFAPVTADETAAVFQLPPPPYAASMAPPEPRESKPAQESDSGAAAPSRRTRSAGRPAVAVDKVAQVGVRLPRDLYEQVQTLLSTRTTRPSWGQLVAWACEDHPEDVLAKAWDSLERSRRTPRGQRLAEEGTLVTLRLMPPELEIFDALLDRARARGAVTKKALAIAALRVSARTELAGS